MDQHVISSQLVAKAPTTLDKVPEDVQLAIIKFIQSWKRSEGPEQEREEGKRARDSALRAVALSCRNLHSVYRPELLSDVTLNIRSLLNFYLGLARDPDSGKSIRSVTLTHRDVGLTRKKLAELQKDLPEISDTLRAQGIRISRSDRTNVLKGALEAVLQSLRNLQILLVLQPNFSFPLQSKLENQRLAPLPFLTHSLRKVFITTWDVESNLKARNVVWILVFCTGLRLASLCCNLDQNDFKYLTESSDAFSGLSQVQKLALGVDFTADETLRGYWETGVGKQWIGGNRKTQAVFNLLKVTKKLQCLDINIMPSVRQEIITTNSSCLSALRTSYLSLESIRLFGLGVNTDDPEEFKANTNISLFPKLRGLSVDAMILLILTEYPDVKFPPDLEVLCLPFYYFDSLFLGDLELIRTFKVRSFPKLETVIVPSNPTSKNGDEIDSKEFNERWLEGRKELEKAEIFTSGKVKLKRYKLEEFISEALETDFMSTLAWISPS